MIQLYSLKKKFLTLLTTLIIAISGSAKEGDTTVITFYTKYDIQQFLGPQWHKSFTYINPNIKYKKAILKIDLGCASYGCCAWDYLFRGFFGKPLPGKDSTITKKTGAQVYRYYQNSDNWEVARLITPYASYMRMNVNGFTPSWTHPYVYDVTDYLPLLKDSVCFAANTGGWDNQGDFGFSMTVKLYLIEGQNDIVPTSIYKIYKDNYTYKTKDSFDLLTPSYKFKLGSRDRYAKFKSIITGHGQQGEFSPVDYYIKLNGNEIYKKSLWRDNCDKTYIQPQSGTWVFSRCSWCPGERIVENDIDLTPLLKPNDSNAVDISLSDFLSPVPSAIDANYYVAGYVVTYSDVQKRDVIIEDVIAPNSDPNYRMSNNMCMNPKIRIKNVGVTTAKQLYIDYWVSETSKKTFIWNGTLKNSESAEIELPALNWTGLNTSSPLFNACLQRSEYNLTTWNDTIRKPFTLPNMYATEKLVLELKQTNGAQNVSNTLTVVDDNNNTIFQRTIQGDSKTYRDTVNVPQGCYKLTLTDMEQRFGCGDGLDYWVSKFAPANGGLGSTAGTFRILNATNNTQLVSFNPDFGGLIMHQFTTMKKMGEYANGATNTKIVAPKIPDSVWKDTSTRASISETKKGTIKLYPNPAKTTINIEMSHEMRGEISYSILTPEGKQIIFGTRNLKNGIETLDVRSLARGAYILIIKNNEQEYFERFLVE